MIKLKIIAGIILLMMAMLELTASFISLPAVCIFCSSYEKWWFEIMPFVFLLNSLASAVLLGFSGVKLLKANLFVTGDKTEILFNKLGRWLEKRKYGYLKSDYEIKSIRRDE